MGLEIQTSEQCHGEPIKSVYLVEINSFKVVDGKLVLKRKYGKHKREIIKIK